MRLVDAVSLRSRRRKLRLFLDELRPTPATTVLDVGADEVGFGADGGHTGCATHNFFEELYPWPGRITALGLHDGAGFRSHYPQIPYVSGDACALPFPDQAFDVVFSNAVIEHVGDIGRQRQFVAEALRVGPAGVHHDPEPLVPDRGAHPAAARPLAAEGGLRPCLRPRPARGGRARTTCSGAVTSAASFPARCASSTSASRSSRSRERAPPPDRARRPDRRARGAQPGDGGAVGRRRPRCGARRRRRLEGRAARRSPSRWRSSRRGRCRSGSGPTGLRSRTPRSCCSTGSCRRAGSTAPRPTAVSSSPRGTI